MQQLHARVPDPQRPRPRASVLCAALLALALGLAPWRTAAAQGEIGALLGATFSTLRGVDGLDTRTGLIGGLSIVLPSRGFLALQPEVLVVNKGAKASLGDPEGLNLSYLEVPLLFRLMLNKGGSVHPHLYAGPYLGLQLECSVKGTSADCNDLPGVSTNTVDVGAVTGGGVGYDLGPFILNAGLRYSFSVSKVAEFTVDTARESAKNGVFILYVGSAIRIGSR